MDGLTTFDIVVGLIVLFLGLKGIIDGLVKELFGLAGIIGGIYVGSHYSEQIGKFFDQNIFHIKNEAALTFIGFLIGLAAFWISMIILAKVFAKLTHLSGLSTLDKLAGFAFGTIKIFLILSVIFYAIYNIEATKTTIKKYTKNSILFPLMVKTGSYIIKLSPEKIINRAKAKTNELKENIQKNIEKETLKDVKEKLKSLENNKTKQ